MYGKYFVLFAMMATGFIMRKKNFINRNTNDGMNRFILYFAFPCLLVGNIGSLDLRGGLLTQFFLMIGMTAGIYVVSTLLGHLYVKIRKLPREISGAIELALVAPNNGFLGFPVTLIFFGGQGLLLMMAHNVMLNIYLYSYGIICLERSGGERIPASGKTILMRLLKILVNPNLIAIYIGFVISLLRVPLLEPVSDYLAKMGAVATPMAMVYIGSLIAESDLGQMVRDPLVWEGAVFKLLLLPVVTALIVWWLPIPMLMKSVLVLGSSFPTAANVAMLSQQRGVEAGRASRILFLSTILSMGSIPLLMQAGPF